MLPLYQRAIEAHRRAFADPPEPRVAAAPGRVNIIGEHTDYNGLPVLPMALDREIAIALSPAGSARVSLVSGDGYPPHEFDLAPEIPPAAPGNWGNYARAAGQALWEWAAGHAPDRLPLQGFRGAVAGNIPPQAGLSSSSALVVAAACALVEVNRLPISPVDLADLLARGERYVGTQGGGMDQAASLLSVAGSALRIDFFPLRAQPVPVFPGAAFVVANSMVRAGKTEGARLAYNTRVAECRLGLEMLKAAAGRQHPAVGEARLLRDFMEAVPEWREVLARLPQWPLNLRQTADHAGLPAEVLQPCLRQRDGSLLLESAGGFQPVRRCRHVLSEGERVGLAAGALGEGRLEDLGRLLDASHESCARDYEISTGELDTLVAVLRRPRRPGSAPDRRRLWRVHRGPGPPGPAVGPPGRGLAGLLPELPPRPRPPGARVPGRSAVRRRAWGRGGGALSRHSRQYRRVLQA